MSFYKGRYAILNRLREPLGQGNVNTVGGETRETSEEVLVIVIANSEVDTFFWHLVARWRKWIVCIQVSLKL